MAWQHTRGEKGLLRENPPTDDLVSASTSLAGATSWLCADVDGLATQVDNIAGAKYYIMLNRHRRSQDHAHHRCTLASDFEEAMLEGYEAEGILLTPRSWL
jgi:hypothetical protein